MSLGQLQGTTVLRATVHGTAGDALVLRQGAERLLSGAGDLVPGMGPEEILCIRRLAAWAPVEASASGEANRAMRESAQRLARAAARPALAPVPPLAQAVLFADRAELLACLARDWLQGLCGLRWWWKALLRNRDASVVLQDAWSEGARDAPAAMAKLASQDLAVHFVRALGAVDAQRLAKAIARAHGVPEFREPLPSISRGRAHRAGTTPPGQKPRPDEAAPEDVRVHVPEALAPSLGGPARALLALALVAHRAPATARSARFARAIVAWAWQPGGSFEARNDARPAMTLPEAWSGAGTFPAGAADASPADRLMDPSGMLQPPAMPLYRRKAEGGARDPAGEPSREAVRPHSDRQEGTTVSRRGIVDSREPTPDSRERAMDRGELEIRPPALPLTSGVGQLPGVALETAVETNLGGLFYLVNAALRLGLYGDFMSPRKPGIELPLWDFLALAAGEWLRDEVRRDPAWRLLASLTGRDSGESPGLRFRPPRAWRLPRDWAEPFANCRGALRWHAGEARLVVTHPAGFTLVDVRRGTSPPELQLRHEIERYPALRGRATERMEAYPGRGRECALQRWCGWIFPYLERRIARELRARAPSTAVRRMLRVPARIEAAAARLDIHIPLARLPLRVRLAGLDRNPGWVPAAGRTIAFHYE